SRGSSDEIGPAASPAQPGDDPGHSFGVSGRRRAAVHPHRGRDPRAHGRHRPDHGRPGRPPGRGDRMNTFVALLVSWLAALPAEGGQARPPPVPAGRRILEPFDYRGVTLHAGPLRGQVDEVRAFYLAIPDDDLLKGFRTRAGRPAPGKGLGGWYGSDTFLVF